MKSIFNLFIVLVVVIGFAGCAENKTRIGEGAGIGGLLGAGAGAIIGHQSGHGVEGALIGGAIGATSGAVGAAGGAAVGSQIEKQPAYDPRVPEPSTKVTLDRIVNWTKQGDSSDEIINRIKSSKASFALTADDLKYLREQGVSQRVIDAMQETR